MSHTKRNKLDRICYLCDKPGATTKDHIPPRGIFPNEIKGNLITVFAHHECAHEFDRLDEDFRQLLIAECSQTLIGRKVWDEQLVDSWKKNRGARQFLLDRLTVGYFEKPNSLETNKVDIILADKRIFEKQMKRFFRAFYFYHNKKCFPSEIELEFNKISYSTVEKSYKENIDNSSWVTVEKDVFRYLFRTAYDHPLACIAIFVFYEFSCYIVMSKTKIKAV